MIKKHSCTSCINSLNEKACKYFFTDKFMSCDGQGFIINCSKYKEKKEKKHICKFCIKGTGYSNCTAVFSDLEEWEGDKKYNTFIYKCKNFKRKPIDKKRKFNCKDHCNYYVSTTVWFCDGESICKFFKRKKVDKVKKDKKKTPKEKLKERFKKIKKKSDLGYSLHYEFKSGKYGGTTVKEVIDRDAAFIDFLINKGFTINSEAVQYLHKIKEKQKKEYEERHAKWQREDQKRQEKNRENAQKWKDDFDRKTREDRKRKHFNENDCRSGDNREDFFRKHFHKRDFFHQASSKILDKKHGGMLGFSGKVQKSDIKKLYYKAALRWHPDKHNNSEDSVEKMKEVNNAWDYFKKKYKIS